VRAAVLIDAHLIPVLDDECRSTRPIAGQHAAPDQEPRRLLAATDARPRASGRERDRRASGHQVRG
jgi:hypothetical protein